jgi:hypothetical protein
MGTRPLYPQTADIHRDGDHVSFGATCGLMRRDKLFDYSIN